MKDFREQNFYELLDITPHASQQEIEVSYQQARRVYSSDSVATYALFQPEELNLIRRRIEEAFRVLNNPERRALYDREILQHEPGWVKTQDAESGDAIAAVSPAPVVLAEASGEAASETLLPEVQSFDAPFVNTQPIELAPEASIVHQPSADPSMSAQGSPSPTVETISTTMAFPASSSPSSSARPPSAPPASSTPPACAPAAASHPPMPEINEQTEFTGSLLAQVRQARGLTLERISDITKINIFYLRAFENEKYADLPADVYVRGYLRQVTNLLGLDSQKVVPSYLARMKKGRA